MSKVVVLSASSEAVSNAKKMRDALVRLSSVQFLVTEGQVEQFVNEMHRKALGAGFSVEDADLTSHREFEMYLIASVYLGIEVGEFMRRRYADIHSADERLQHLAYSFMGTVESAYLDGRGMVQEDIRFLWWRSFAA